MRRIFLGLSATLFVLVGGAALWWPERVTGVFGLLVMPLIVVMWGTALVGMARTQGGQQQQREQRYTWRVLYQTILGRLNLVCIGVLLVLLVLMGISFAGDGQAFRGLGWVTQGVTGLSLLLSELMRERYALPKDPPSKNG
jgi:hypothetical protein